MEKKKEIYHIMKCGQDNVIGYSSDRLQFVLKDRVESDWTVRRREDALDKLTQR